MGRHKQSIDSITLEAIEQAISSIPNSSVVRKLTILSSYSRLKTEEIAKAFRINPRTLFRWISQFKDQGVEGLVDKPKGRKPALLTDEMKRQLVQWIEKRIVMVRRYLGRWTSSGQNLKKSIQ